MTNPAATADLVARWRPLSAQEATNGQTFLDDAWRMLRRRVPSMVADMAADTSGDLTAEAVRVMCTAVLRVMKNPDGKRQESIDDYSWTRDQALSAGLLYFTAEEIDDLVPVRRGRMGSFSVLPVGYPTTTFTSQ